MSEKMIEVKYYPTIEAYMEYINSLGKDDFFKHPLFDEVKNSAKRLINADNSLIFEFKSKEEANRYKILLNNRLNIKATIDDKKLVINKEKK
ncbi:hypothetical protein [Caminibacter sp.]